MKRLFKFGMAMAIAIMLASCGSNKNMANQQNAHQPTNPTPVEPKSPTVSQQLQDLDNQIALAKKQRILDSIRRAGIYAENHQFDVDPCGEFMDDEDYFREYGIATHINQGSAQSLSIDVARENLKKHLAEFVQGFSSSYRNLYSGSKPYDDIQRKMEGKMLGAVEYMVNASEKVCQKYRIDNRGNYVYYAAFQVSKHEFKKEVTEELNQLSKDEKMDIDFRDQRFQKK